MLANGEHHTIVRERLGHAHIVMPRRYSRVTMGRQCDAGDRVDAALQKAFDEAVNVGS